MHNIFSRANSLLSFSLWVMAGVTAACFFSTVFLDYQVPAKLNINDIKVRNTVDYAKNEERLDLATFNFNLKADFTKIFNWNVKQLFLYIVAEYKTPANEVNQVIVWDRIVERSERVVIDEISIKPKYYFIDDGSYLLNHQNVTFLLRYNVLPNSGYLRLVQSPGPVVVPFPTTYTTTRRA